MYFSRSFIASAVAGLATATTHAGEMANMMGSTAAAGAASETLVASGEMAGMMASATAVMASEAMMASSAAVAASETLMASGEMAGMASSASETLMASGGMIASQASTGAQAAATGGAAAEGTVATHVVQVGGPNGTLVFAPENIQAMPGDMVQFQFNPKNHSVVQSTFDQPCVPIQNVMPNKTDAFFSGFMPSNATAIAAGNVLTYTIRVMDTKPIWFYCSQGMHCQGGMVGAINAPATGEKTMAAFKALAESATENLSPGQVAGEGAAQASQAPGAAQPSGGAGGAGATGTTPGAATSSSADQAAQQSVNAAPGHVSQSLLGLGLGGLAAFMAL